MNSVIVLLHFSETSLRAAFLLYSKILYILVLFFHSKIY